mmetsp:Transcript_4842/g.4033  ORF Transcript_4842/g.4033 Transcript_4842/m.4033 type:complete len:90 (+) Transcript_4842:270-539(+)
MIGSYNELPSHSIIHFGVKIQLIDCDDPETTVILLFDDAKLELTDVCVGPTKKICGEENIEEPEARIYTGYVKHSSDSLELKIEMLTAV